MEGSKSENDDKINNIFVVKKQLSLPLSFSFSSLSTITALPSSTNFFFPLHFLSYSSRFSYSFNEPTYSATSPLSLPNHSLRNNITYNYSLMPSCRETNLENITCSNLLKNSNKEKRTPNSFFPCSITISSPSLSVTSASKDNQAIETYSVKDENVHTKNEGGLHHEKTKESTNHSITYNTSTTLNIKEHDVLQIAFSSSCSSSSSSSIKRRFSTSPTCFKKSVFLSSIRSSSINVPALTSSHSFSGLYNDKIITINNITNNNEILHDGTNNACNITHPSVSSQLNIFYHSSKPPTLCSSPFNVQKTKTSLPSQELSHRSSMLVKSNFKENKKLKTTFPLLFSFPHAARRPARLCEQLYHELTQSPHFGFHMNGRDWKQIFCESYCCNYIDPLTLLIIRVFTLIILFAFLVGDAFDYAFRFGSIGVGMSLCYLTNWTYYSNVFFFLCVSILSFLAVSQWKKNEDHEKRSYVYKMHLEDLEQQEEKQQEKIEKTDEDEIIKVKKASKNIKEKKNYINEREISKKETFFASSPTVRFYNCEFSEKNKENRIIQKETGKKIKEIQISELIKECTIVVDQEEQKTDKERKEYKINICNILQTVTNENDNNISTRENSESAEQKEKVKKIKKTERIYGLCRNLNGYENVKSSHSYYGIFFKNSGKNNINMKKLKNKKSIVFIKDNEILNTTRTYNNNCLQNYNRNYSFYQNNNNNLKMDSIGRKLLSINNINFNILKKKGITVKNININHCSSSNEKIKNNDYSTSINTNNNNNNNIFFADYFFYKNKSKNNNSSLNEDKFIKDICENKYSCNVKKNNSIGNTLNITEIYNNKTCEKKKSINEKEKKKKQQNEKRSAFMIKENCLQRKRKKSSINNKNKNILQKFKKKRKRKFGSKRRNVILNRIILRSDGKKVKKKGNVTVDENDLNFHKSYTLNTDKLDSNKLLSSMSFTSPSSYSFPPWYVIITWLTHDITLSSTVLVALVFWLILVPEGYRVTKIADYWKHLVNAIIIVLHAYISRIPTFISHIVYVWAWSVAYCLLSIFVYIFDIPNATGENGFIYIFLNFNDRSITACLVIVIVIFIFIPFVQIIIFIMMGWRRNNFLDPPNACCIEKNFKNCKKTKLMNQGRNQNCKDEPKV